jgi:hypothetical protein
LEEFAHPDLGCGLLGGGAAFDLSLKSLEFARMLLEEETERAGLLGSEIRSWPRI